MLKCRGYFVHHRTDNTTITGSIFQDVEKAKKERERAAMELESQKAKWREANGKFLQLLGSNGDCDIDKLLTDSVAMRKRLDEEETGCAEADAPSADGTKRGSGSYKLRAKRVRQLLELEMFSNQEMQEMAVSILEAIVIKV